MKLLAFLFCSVLSAHDFFVCYPKGSFIDVLYQVSTAIGVANEKQIDAYFPNLSNHPVLEFFPDLCTTLPPRPIRGPVIAPAYEKNCELIITSIDYLFLKKHSRAIYNRFSKSHLNPFSTQIAILLNQASDLSLIQRELRNFSSKQSFLIISKNRLEENILSRPFSNVYIEPSEPEKTLAIVMKCFGCIPTSHPLSWFASIVLAEKESLYLD